MKSNHLFGFDLYMHNYLGGRKDSASLICTCNPHVYCAVLTFLAYHVMSYSSLHVHVRCSERPHRRRSFQHHQSSIACSLN
jgi:hypothetical protein